MHLAPSLEGKRIGLHGKTQKAAGFQAPIDGWFWALTDNTVSAEGVLILSCGLFKDERETRSVVIIRKNSYEDRSNHLADPDAILMNTFRTLRKRGRHAILTIANVISTHIETSQLRPHPLLQLRQTGKVIHLHKELDKSGRPS